MRSPEVRGAPCFGGVTFRTARLPGVVHFGAGQGFLGLGGRALDRFHSIHHEFQSSMYDFLFFVFLVSCSVSASYQFLLEQAPLLIILGYVCLSFEHGLICSG